eukprot:Protomagalhaensia_wolfi_Nauph_80__6004@NODE_817_length_1979_cov_3196_396392_g613_i0_p4_GENE_NODE_817_length_1979_cov_3196_396392_g613_i0NODE_817_length_1979_cov_3196_396392_g613_i0_p4_ORF_typecomplete_len139_score1_62zfU1/PF06220_12/3_4e18ARS2/PF04959_13/2_NODE_817_length_1979_cov_3196_396392_g613_i08691285
MPKYYCEYCDINLTHSSPAGRRQHNSGRRHINNKIEYYQNLIRDPSFIPPAHVRDASFRPQLFGSPFFQQPRVPMIVRPQMGAPPPAFPPRMPGLGANPPRPPQYSLPNAGLRPPSQPLGAFPPRPHFSGVAPPPRPN